MQKNRSFFLTVCDGGSIVKDIMNYFNELTVDLNDEAFFPSDIYERTKRNPNPVLSGLCSLSNGSLDEYADELSEKILDALEG